MLRRLGGDGWSGGCVHLRDNWSVCEQKSSSEGLHGKEQADSYHLVMSYHSKCVHYFLRGEAHKFLRGTRKVLAAGAAAGAAAATAA